MTKKKNKKCSIPVLKTKPIPYCKYHEQRMEEPHDGLEKKPTQAGPRLPNKHKTPPAINDKPDEDGLMITEDSDGD